MQDRETRLNGFIEMFEYGLLKDAGKVTAAIAKILLKQNLKNIELYKINCICLILIAIC